MLPQKISKMIVKLNEEKLLYRRLGVKLIPLAFLVGQNLRIESQAPALLARTVSPPQQRPLHLRLPSLKIIAPPVLRPRQNLARTTPVPRLQPYWIISQTATEVHASHSNRLLGYLLQHLVRRRRPFLTAVAAVFLRFHSNLADLTSYLRTQCARR